MAQRRMFSMKIIDTDMFLDMPISSQLLYFHLCMRADDDGFVSSPKKIVKMVNCSDDDFKILIMKKFILPFETGICVIMHWRIHNYIQKDRYNKTLYQNEINILTDIDGTYGITSLEGGGIACIQDVHKMDTQVRLGKVSLELGKDSIVDIPYKEIIDYLNLKANTNYKHTGNKTRDLINARWHEKFTLEDFKQAINNKTLEWIGTDFEKYLVPATLFGPKFEGYVNQKIGKSKSNFKGKPSTDDNLSKRDFDITLEDKLLGLVKQPEEDEEIIDNKKIMEELKNKAMNKKEM